MLPIVMFSKTHIITSPLPLKVPNNAVSRTSHLSVYVKPDDVLLRFVDNKGFSMIPRASIVNAFSKTSICDKICGTRYVECC